MYSSPQHKRSRAVASVRAQNAIQQHALRLNFLATAIWISLVALMLCLGHWG
jgi:hypothetical protein